MAGIGSTLEYIYIFIKVSLCVYIYICIQRHFNKYIECKQVTSRGRRKTDGQTGQTQADRRQEQYEWKLFGMEMEII